MKELQNLTKEQVQQNLKGLLKEAILNKDEALLKSVLYEIYSSGDKELLLEFPPLAAALPFIGKALGAVAAASVATTASDALGVTDGAYDWVAPVDPWNYVDKAVGALIGDDDDDDDTTLRKSTKHSDMQKEREWSGEEEEDETGWGEDEDDDDGGLFGGKGWDKIWGEDEEEKGDEAAGDESAEENKRFSAEEYSKLAKGKIPASAAPPQVKDPKKFEQGINDILDKVQKGEGTEEEMELISILSGEE
jgi:hypothetical protein